MEAWVSNENLSSFFLQVKVENSSNPQHFLVGLSFRVQNNTTSSDSYGFSLYRYDSSNNCNRDWCKNAYGIQKNLKADHKVYAVLWKRVSDQYTVLAYAEMVSSYGVASNGDLLKWPVLLLRVNERSDGNHLKAYVRKPSNPTTGNINWSIASFKPVEWTGTCTLNSCATTAPFTEVVDTTFSSSGFARVLPKSGRKSVSTVFTIRIAIIANFLMISVFLSGAPVEAEANIEKTASLISRGFDFSKFN